MRLRLHAPYEPNQRCINRIPLQPLGPGFRRDDGGGERPYRPVPKSSASPAQPFAGTGTAAWALAASSIGRRLARTLRIFQPSFWRTATLVFTK